MTAWMIVDTKITDDAAYEDYKVKARPIAEKHGGEYVARGGTLDIVEADLWHPTRLVIIRFPDMGAARDFVDDPDYQAAKHERGSVAEATMVIVDGI